MVEPSKLLLPTDTDYWREKTPTPQSTSPSLGLPSDLDVSFSFRVFHDTDSISSSGLAIQTTGLNQSELLTGQGPLMPNGGQFFSSPHGRPPNQRRRSQSQSNLAHRHPSAPVASSSTTTNTPPHIPSQTPPSSQLAPSRPPSYNQQQSGYIGQYTSPNRSPLQIAHNPPFPYTHGYPRPPVHVQEGLSIHPGLQPVMQHPSVYQYHPSNDTGSSRQYSGTSQTFGHLQADPSPSPLPFLSNSPHSSRHLSHGTGQFHSLHYPTPHATPQFPYSTQSFHPTGGSQYQYSQTPQYQRRPEQDSRGVWWYLPPPTPIAPHQYDGSVSSYLYPTSYPTSPSTEVQLGYIQPSAPSYPALQRQVTGSFTQEPPRQSPTTVAPEPVRATLSLPSTSPAANTPTAGTTSAEKTPEAAPPTEGRKPTGAGSKQREKPIVRRSYHPNPPTHRSEWVMWTGNVPSDATHDELWQFLSQGPPIGDNSTPISDSASPVHGGILSIFLISRSSCAFVNFETEAHLHAAIARFHSKPLRPNDPRCPKLVCRMRRVDDDLKAGVGAQRGTGVHLNWVKEKRKEERAAREALATVQAVDAPSTPAPVMPENPGPAAASSDDDKTRSSRVQQYSENSGSFSSSNSSLLSRFFPKRYFILKSLTQFDLDLSVKEGLWATQKHNEVILDQAFRTSKDVYLIFSVNKSGEFYGYARMAEPILRGKHHASWAARDSRSSQKEGGNSAEPELGSEPPPMLLSAERLVDESPAPVSSSTDVLPSGGPTPLIANHSAPAILGRPAQKISYMTPGSMHSLNAFLQSTRLEDDFELDPSAPERARKKTVDSPIDPAEGEAEPSPQPLVPEDAGKPESQQPPVETEQTWGESFRVEWLCTERLPFYRTRHIRNPWNQDREVKVSRDGTEIEPGAGQRLLDEWARIAEPASSQVQPSSGGKPPPPMSARRQSKAPARN